MNESQNQPPTAPVVIRKPLAKRILWRLMLVVLIPILGYALLIVVWILTAPRI
jgi:hypothetical protein